MLEMITAIIIIIIIIVLNIMIKIYIYKLSLAKRILKTSVKRKKNMLTLIRS